MILKIVVKKIDLFSANFLYRAWADQPPGKGMGNDLFQFIIMWCLAAFSNGMVAQHKIKDIREDFLKPFSCGII